MTNLAAHATEADELLLDDAHFEASLDDLLTVAEDIERLQTVTGEIREPSPALIEAVQRLVGRREGVRQLGERMKKLVEHRRRRERASPGDAPPRDLRFERFFSIYLEHVGGNFPTWISPKQAIILTVSDKVDDYAADVLKKLQAKGLRVDLDNSADKLGAKIRNARLARYPYLCVVGAKEAETGALGVRSRDKGELGAIPLDEFVAKLVEEAKAPSGEVASA